MAACPILTYHSQLIFGNDYHDNSHVALAEDLERIRAAGRRVVPLAAVVDALCANDTGFPYGEVVVVTFDDGTGYDWFELEHPQHGPQASFAAILRRQAARQGAWCGATSFVLASAQARAAIAQEAMGDAGLMRDDWWAQAQREGVLDIQSHGWDHRHPSLPPDAIASGHFFGVADAASCELQVERAAEEIGRVSGRRPDLFAYPYGQASDYLRREYLPQGEARHGFRAAVGTEPAHAHAQSDRWYLPRYIHVENWKTPGELDALLRG